MSKITLWSTVNPNDQANENEQCCMIKDYKVKVCLSFKLCKSKNSFSKTVAIGEGGSFSFLV